MLGAIPASAALLCAYHDRDGHCSTRHVAKFGGLIHNLVGSHQGKIHEQQFHHWPHPNQRRADAEAHETGLTDWCVAYPVGAKLIDQILRHTKDTAVMADIFPHEEHAWIDSHLFTER